MSMGVDISFHGAAGTVTGSCTLLEFSNLKVLVDCGLFQGRKWEDYNHEEFGFDPSDVDVLLLTHGHLDHCGRIPLLVKRGFRGRIISTPATADIAKIVLMDSAHIQEEDAEHWKRLSMRKGQKPPEPLYDSLEALDALSHFSPSARYDKPVKLGPGITARFRDAGHILGAAFLEIEEKNRGRIIFSGDLGNRGKPIIEDPSMPGAADALVVESTYANRDHRSLDESVEELAGVINSTFARGGNVLIPSFAIERAQDLLFVLRELRTNDRIPFCSVYLDSPMAINITEIMRRYPEHYDEETCALFKQKVDPFGFEGLKFTKTQDASRKINSETHHAIIIAGSGMCTGGRIKHHLKHHIWRPESTLVFVGYQARGTLGREIVDGEKRVKIFGESYKVKAAVKTIGGFSSHADRSILREWISKTERPQHLFITHGEDEVRKLMARDIEDGDLAEEIHLPEMNQLFSV